MQILIDIQVKSKERIEGHMDSGWEEEEGRKEEGMGKREGSECSLARQISVCSTSRGPHLPLWACCYTFKGTVICASSALSFKSGKLQFHHTPLPLLVIDGGGVRMEDGEGREGGRTG